MFMPPDSPSHRHIVRLEPKDPRAVVSAKAVVGRLAIGEVRECGGETPQPVTLGDCLLSIHGNTVAFARLRVLPQELPETGAMRRGTRQIADAP